MPKTISPNGEAQAGFIDSQRRYAAYIGGLGSGKTFAGIVRGLRFSQQPVAQDSKGPRGLVGAISYPVLKDVVLPEFFEIMEGTGLWKYGNEDNSYVKSERKALLKANCKCRDRKACRHVAEILFRSLDEPNRIRGVKLSWFFLDEGRHLSNAAWKVLIGRLRQQGYRLAGWVCSTPNGFDWMWALFHPDSPDRHPDSEWYGASTYENRANLPDEYIADLEASYEGRFFEQEVRGKFVGVVTGAVYPHWDNIRYVQDLEYERTLPLYTGWDFGIGDPGVCLFLQVHWREKELPSGGRQAVPWLHILGYVEAKDWSAKDWGQAYRAWLLENTDGILPMRNWGDPAGRQRQSASGTSVIDALRAEGVVVLPAPIRPRDFGITVLDNMMAGGRVLCDKTKAGRVAAALATHRWPVDDNGQRVGNNPVHDWTSHFGDAIRYFAVSELSHFPRRLAQKETKVPPPPGTMGHIIKQLVRPDKDEWLGPQPEAALDLQGVFEKLG